MQPFETTRQASLGFFRNEPGHPQELCMLLFIALMATGILAENPRARRTAMFLAGGLAAALALVKVNIGIFAVLAVALAVLFEIPRHPLANALRYLTAFAALVLPVTMMQIHLDDPRSAAYCVVVTVSIASVLTAQWRASRSPSLSFRDAWTAAAGFAGVFAAVLAVMLSRGVTMQAMLQSLLLAHMRVNVQQSSWYLALDLHIAWIVWAVAGLIAAVAVGFKGRTLAGPAKAVIGAIALASPLAGAPAGAGFIAPVCWMVMEGSYALRLAAFAVVLQTLYAYPIAGSQKEFIQVPLIVAAATLLGQGLRGLPARPRTPALLRAAAVSTVGLVILSYAGLAYRAKQDRDIHPSLNLPGAELVHAEPEEVAEYQWLARQLKDCETFVSMPGVPSLYFWTGKPMPGPSDRYPGGMGIDNWMYGLSPAQQQTIVDDLSRYPGACAVYNPSDVNFWNRGGADLSGLPLVSYIQTSFHTVGQKGDFQFMIRNGRPSPANAQ
jgi:hypothetical protein